jgi:hypothetical protein
MAKNFISLNKSMNTKFTVYRNTKFEAYSLNMLYT